MKIIARYYYIIVIISIFTHGLILINDGIFWDGWMIHGLHNENDWINLYEIFSQSGVIFFAYFHRIMGLLPNFILGYRIIAFFSLLLSGIYIYKIGCISGYLNCNESLFISLISITYPAYQVLFEIILVPYIVCYLFFWLAVWVTLISMNSEKFKRISLRICSLFCFLISFNVNSLLVFYFGFLFLLFFVFSKKRMRLLSKNFFILFLNNIDFFFLPFLYWFVKELFFPRHGLYSSYNQFQTSFHEIFRNLIIFIKNSVFGQLVNATEVVSNNIAITIFGILIILLVISRRKPLLEENNLSNPLIFLLYGFLIFILGILPYILTGLSPSVYGWSTRHNLLISLPLAFIIIGLIRLFFDHKNNFNSFSNMSLFFILFIIFSFSLTMISNHLNWHIRWIKDSSVMINLSKINGAENYSIFLVDDQFIIDKIDNNYRFYEYSSMFENIWGDETRIGLNKNDKFSKNITKYNRYFTKSYNLSEFNPYGCQALLIITPGYKPSSKLSFFTQYLYFKYIKPDNLQDFMVDVTRIEIHHIDTPESIDCIL